MKKIVSLFFLFLVSLYVSLFSTLAYGATSSPIPLINPDELHYHELQFVPPQAQRVVLDNGIIVYVFEDHELPLLNVSAVIRTGSDFDPVGKEGLAEITGTLLRTGGTKTMSADTIDEALDFFAGSLSVSMGRDSGSINLSVLKDNLDEGLQIFSQIITNPSFEKSKINLAKDLKIEELRRIADDPPKLAFRELRRYLYRDHPAGRLPTIGSIKNVQRVDLIQFYKQFFYPKNTMIAVSGNITKDQVVMKIKKYLGTWNESVKQYTIPTTPVKHKGSIYFLLKDIPQSVIISAQFAPGKKSADAYPFEVLDFILGSGGFKSRIFQQIRNNLGLAYSTGSFYTRINEYGVFYAYAMTKSETTAKVLSNIQAIINDVKKNEIDSKELAGAIKSINNNFIFSFRSAEDIVHQQLMIEYDNLPRDYLTMYRQRIAAVQAEVLKRVANTHLSSEHAVILVVGNEKAYNQLVSSFGSVTRIENSL